MSNMKNFALVGNPNCGKTTLFNSLTGSTAHVGNWPGVTVDKREGVCKIGKKSVNIIDLPGIYSLSPYTPEEVVSRNYIIDEKPDCVINIIDTTNLERNLYLTTQIMEMDVPVVLALNMMDIVEKNGDKINAEKLSEILGIPVLSISALKEKNLKDLIDAAFKESEKGRKGKTILSNSILSHLITDLSIAFESLDISNPLFHACKLAELDEVETKNHPNLVKMVEHFRDENVSEKFGIDYEALIADERYKYITTYLSPCMKKANKNIANDKRQDKIDKVFTHKFFGIPLFLLIMFLIFECVFSQNLFFLHPLIKQDCFSFISDDSFLTGFKGLFYTASNGINSPGMILYNAVNGLTYMATYGMRALLSSSPAWVSGLVCDGILGGVFAVLGFMPQILLLFLLFSILEDSGYMARVAFIIDRLLTKFGLSGRSLLPMIMGFGCSVPAIANTRTIADEDEKVATIRVIPFFSCGAKLPVLTAVSGYIAISFGFANVGLITFGMYVLGIVVAILAVLFMRNTTLLSKSSPFIMELPPYHMPQVKSTLLLVWDKAKHFIKKAFTIILASTIVVWFISHFGVSDNGLWTYTDNMNNSILAMLGKIIQPLFIPVGFGLGKYGWVFVVAVFSGLIAKENVIATLNTLTGSILGGLGITFSSNNAGEVFVNCLKDSSSALFDPFFASHGVAILLAFIAFNMLTIPCIATVTTARSELKKKKFYFTLLFWILVSFIVSGMIFTIGSFWWASFIWIAFVALMVVFVILFRRHKMKKLKGGNKNI